MKRRENEAMTSKRGLEPTPINTIPEKRHQARLRQIDHDALSVAEKIAKAKGRDGNSAREIKRLEKQLA